MNGLRKSLLDADNRNHILTINKPIPFNEIQSDEEKEACFCCSSWDKKIEAFLKNYKIVNIIFNRGPAVLGAFSALIIATKKGISRWPYPSIIGITITGGSSFISNLSLLFYFSITNTIEESRKARKLMREQTGVKYYLSWGTWYFLWACLIGALGQGELTAGGTIPFWLPDNQRTKHFIFYTAIFGFVLSRMYGIPRLIQRWLSKNIPDDLQDILEQSWKKAHISFEGSNPDEIRASKINHYNDFGVQRFTWDEKFFYYLSYLISGTFVLASFDVLWGMYGLKWLIGCDKFFHSQFCNGNMTNNCLDADTSSRIFSVIPSLLTMTGFYFSQERGVFHCWLACKEWYYYCLAKRENTQPGAVREVIFILRLSTGVISIIFIPSYISYASIQGLLDPNSRIQLFFEIALPYFLLVNATSMWRGLKKLIAKLNSQIEAQKISNSLPSFFNSNYPSRMTATALTFMDPMDIPNGNHNIQTMENNQSGFWNKLKNCFSCCRSNRSRNGMAYTPLNFGV